jgi:hypothetical protein
MLGSARRRMPVPPLARWLPGLDVAATLTADVAHGDDDPLQVQAEQEFADDLAAAGGVMDDVRQPAGGARCTRRR